MSSSTSCAILMSWHRTIGSLTFTSHYHLPFIIYWRQKHHSSLRLKHSWSTSFVLRWTQQTSFSFSKLQAKNSVPGAQSNSSALLKSPRCLQMFFSCLSLTACYVLCFREVFIQERSSNKCLKSVNQMLVLHCSRSLFIKDTEPELFKSLIFCTECTVR